MNSWTDTNARQNTVRAFVENVFKNQGDRDRCKTDRPFAKNLFAEKGGFEIEGTKPDATKIPAKMEFRVYEEKDPQPRDEDLGIMVLPETLQTPVDVSQVWIC